MSKFNGHRNWNHWNVSLWINNDEGLYSLAREHVRHARTKDEAARRMLTDLEEICGSLKTPDGAPYSISSIRAVSAEAPEHQAAAREAFNAAYRAAAAPPVENFR